MSLEMIVLIPVDSNATASVSTSTVLMLKPSHHSVPKQSNKLLFMTSIKEWCACIN